MINIFMGFLTFVLVADALFLILLVLIQLPKKEAGLGTAFGGATTEALFGAGTGNVLTSATKYAAGIFLALSLTLSIMNAHRVGDRDASLSDSLREAGAPAPAALPATPAAEVPAPAETAPAVTETNAAPEASTAPAGLTVEADGVAPVTVPAPAN